MDEVIDATIILSPSYISIGYNNDAGLHTQQKITYSSLTYRYDVSTQNTVIANTNSKEMLFVKQNIIADLDEAVAWNKKPWLAKKIGQDGWKLLATFLVAVGIITALYLMFVPYLSEQLGKKISKKTEATLGQKMYDVMVDTTKRDVELSGLLNTYFKNLEITTDYKINITVVKDNTVNAFAIMGGNIVVYTGLLQKIRTKEELAALLCHEFSHIEYRHTTRSVFRSLGKKVFLSLLLGDMGSVTNVLISNAENLNGLHYSRKLEKEADIKGLEILNEKALSGEGFEQLFKHLKEQRGNGVAEILSSHPDIENRIKYIKKDKNYNTGKKTILSDKLETIFHNYPKIHF